MKKAWVILLVAIVICALIFGLLGACLIGNTVWGIFDHVKTVRTERLSNEPQIKYGEFPFSVTYEINGERITVEDTYVCELERVSYNLEIGYQREWKGYIKSTGWGSILIISFVDGDNEIEIIMDVGSPEQYMENEFNTDESISPKLYQFMHYPNGNKTIDSVIDETYIERFGLKIIDYNMSKPIVNSFGNKK